MCVCACLCMRVCISVSVCVSVSLSVWFFSVSVVVCLCLSLSVCASACMFVFCVSLPVSPHAFVTVSLWVSVCLTLCRSLPVFESVLVPLCPYVFLRMSCLLHVFACRALYASLSFCPFLSAWVCASVLPCLCVCTCVCVRLFCTSQSM